LACSVTELYKPLLRFRTALLSEVDPTVSSLYVTEVRQRRPAVLTDGAVSGLLLFDLVVTAKRQTKQL
jgi:hypothetical protein